MDILDANRADWDLAAARDNPCSRPVSSTEIDWWPTGTVWS
jgi:hypothetical protein